MTRERINLDAMLSPQSARVLVRVDESGDAQQAWFDLAGLPRVDAHLVGQPVREVPRIVERLCGICPAAHHLAGIRALEALLGLGATSWQAENMRRLLHHGSAMDALAVRLFAEHRERCLQLRRVGKLAMKVAGSPGHFPSTAVPGGVSTATDPALVRELSEVIAEAVEAAEHLAEGLVRDAAMADVFAGPDVALVDESGRPDLLGTRLRAVTADGDVVVRSAAPPEWPTLVGEARPGQTAPRPFLTVLGQDKGVYRVGPMAQLRIGALTTPRAAALQGRWLTAHGGVVAARAIMLLHSCEVVASLAANPAELDAEPNSPIPETTSPTLEPTSPFPELVEGIGWVDSPRGLLVHAYTADATGRLVKAQILTPTAQNEPWLGQMLLGAVGSPERVEASIQTADPCLPCVSAPPGQMPVTVETIEQES
ncbi:nickel-dependent hydrogenase large subunit [Luteococcus sp. OSA5]|uniref:nickel-dependent hydrogenase large subunit n=1 Tax=Luteococcus sp. OSA5 TaxID=3401630 RepID=UPI003B42E12C